MQPIEFELENLYRQLGVFEVSLQNACERCNECWRGHEGRKWTTTDIEETIESDGYDPTHIYYPWIGKHYLDTRILILGINMNTYGGLEAQKVIVGDWVKKGLHKGKKHLLRSEAYAGTLYWHRVPCYVSILLDALETMPCDFENNGLPTCNTLMSSLDYFAVSNSIKCAPVGDKSKPSAQMWQHCVPFILKKEINVLRPKTILIMGNSENLSAFNSYVLDNPAADIQECGAVRKGYGYIDGNEVEFFVFPHPTSYGGSNYKIAEDFKQLLYAKQVDVFSLLKEQLEKNIPYPVEYSKHSLGNAESGFYFHIPGWKDFVIGFEFEESFARKFFFGLCEKKVSAEIVEAKRQEIRNRLNMHGEQTEVWPYWEWFKEKNWHRYTYDRIKDGSFIEDVKGVVERILAKTVEMEL